MSLSAALHLASLGFHVFPLVPESKLPLIEDFPRRATRDPERIKEWWLDPVLAIEQPYNVGVSTSRFGDEEALIVIDVDNKGDKDGDAELLRLELQGLDLPPTFEQHTPTGGRHLVFRSHFSCKQGTDVLGRGLDIRSKGGFIVGAGSTLELGTYTAEVRPVAVAPAWLPARLKTVDPERAKQKGVESPVASRSAKRATEYLVNHAPVAVEGEAGDFTTFKVACKVKDLGCDEATAFELMFERWNNRCSPPWSHEALRDKVENAYAYGENNVGVDDPAAQFEVVPEEKKLTPIQELNQEFAYIGGDKGCILWETSDVDGNFQVKFIEVKTFHLNEIHRKVPMGDGWEYTTKVWIHSKERRKFDDVLFDPSGKSNPRFYNLWRGFPVKPLDRPPNREEKAALEDFISHIHTNICGGSEDETRWFISYFAHLFQKPWELPASAIVLKGAKGVGKSSVPEILSPLLGECFMSVSDPDAILGRFNYDCENKLLAVLEEAVWGGDKNKESRLKDTITAPVLRVERKYMDSKKVKNYMRLVIVGNEDWLVSASEDERRYAVFNVGNGRKQDNRFFGRLKERMIAGANRYLLSYLLNYDISSVDLRQPPKTQGLSDQKDQSLSPVLQWWKDCLNEGRILGMAGSEFRHSWPESVTKESVMDAYVEYSRKRNIGSRLSTIAQFSKQLQKRCPSLDWGEKRIEGERFQTYFIPKLELARREWDKTGNQISQWPIELGDEKEIFR